MTIQIQVLAKARARSLETPIQAFLKQNVKEQGMFRALGHEGCFLFSYFFMVHGREPFIEEIPRLVSLYWNKLFQTSAFERDNHLVRVAPKTPGSRCIQVYEFNGKLHAVVGGAVGYDPLGESVTRAQGRLVEERWYVRS